MEPRRLDFRDHRRELGDNRYVYPVLSRRSKGLSIGVNLNPDKVCNFDCPYCQVDRTTPPRVRRVELARLEAELEQILSWAASGHLWERAPFDTAPAALRRVSDVAFAGDGEPTSYLEFAEAVRIAGRQLLAHGLEVRPVVLTNATLLHRPRVQEGLRELDRLGGRLWAKLDAGTEAYFQFVDGTDLSFDRVLHNLRLTVRERPIVVQSMFLGLHGLGPSAEEVRAWADRLGEIAAEGAVELVQVYTVARVPARPSIEALPVAELERIADAARAKGLEVEVYP